MRTVINRFDCLIFDFVQLWKLNIFVCVCEMNRSSFRADFELVKHSQEVDDGATNKSKSPIQNI